MKNTFVLLLIVVVCSCTNQKETLLNEIADVPKELKEVSGIAISNHDIYCIEDSGNDSEIIIIDSVGSVVRRLKVNDTPNTDWEDLTFDKNGNLYIGDFGNNDNTRNDLAIYQISSEDTGKEAVSPSKKITFDYPEQTEFPPKKTELMFDVEAFFEYNNFFYLFTKNRSKNFDSSSYVYKIPNKEGHHHAILVRTIKTCNDYNYCAITSASISPDQTKFVLLSHSKVWMYPISYIENTTTNPIEIDLNHYSQKEAIVFKDDSTLYVADEKVKKSGGKLYEFKLNSVE
ncbi:hypothetical protein [Flavobacterium sp.]|uniref:hypothetical protein n=1 Tax=Flavobacterium sp. TaxID=239 RepID=UPI002B4ABCCB|nr:hypothetical protein [Flavobacterium sp.]HLP64710.1 hypothetical protein [Flavobacterium sp.]